MTTRSLAIVATLSLAVVACDGLMKSDTASAPPAQKRPAVTDEAHIEADIMAGRVEVMIEQTRTGLQALGVPLPAAVENPTDRETYRRLVDAVERYNELTRVACTGGAATGDLCKPEPYLPMWYAGRARPDTSPVGLKTAAEEMQSQMVPLWDAVCVKAKAKTGDEHFCAIE